MKPRGRKLATVGLIAAAAAWGGCNTQPLGPVAPHPPTASGGTSGSAATNGGGGRPNGGGGRPSGGGGSGVGGSAGVGTGPGAGGFGAGTGPGNGGSFGAGSGGALGTGSGGAFGTGSGGAFGTGRGGAFGTGSGGSFGAGSGGAGATTGSGGTGPCPGIGYQTNVQAPDILIVMSRSQGMDLGTDGQPCSAAGCSRWEQLQAAVDGIVSTNPDLSYGLMFFGSGGAACNTPEYPDLNVTPGNWTDVVYDTGLVSPGGAAPMAGALASAVTYLETFYDGSSKQILLVTDGAANCPPGDQTGTTDDTGEAVGAIASAASAGFLSFVLAVADPTNAQLVANLNAMARAGMLGQQYAATAYYDAANGGVAALDSALAAETSQTPDCTFLTPNGEPPGSPLRVTIEHDNMITVVPYDPTRMAGWNYTDSTYTAVTLDGEYCSQLGAPGQTTIELIFQCGSVPPGLPVP